jgi:uncharacterized membrane protein YphA (DoxX/SURF4 family)
MPAAVLWPSVLGLTFFLAGLYTYRRDFFAPAPSDRSRMLAWGPLFIAAPLATFSSEHFTAARALANAVPRWLPLHLAITYFVGVDLVAAALSFVARRCMRWSASMLALMFALFVLTLHLPAAIRHADKRIFWVFPLREGSFALGAFSVFIYQSRESWTRRVDTFALIARLFTAVVLIYFGLQNLLDPQFAPGVPDSRPTSSWVPAHLYLAYLVGSIQVLLGIVTLFKKTAVRAITSEGVLMTVLTIFLFGPDLFLSHGVQNQVTAINFVADTMLFAGTMFAIARAVDLADSQPTERAAGTIA